MTTPIKENNRQAADMLREWADTIETEEDASYSITLASRIVHKDSWDNLPGEVLATVMVRHWPRGDWDMASIVLAEAIETVEEAPDDDLFDSALDPTTH